MFTVYHSNQLDILKRLMVELIKRQPLQDPFQQEVILVQSPGMAQWLQIELAGHFGIAANIHFPLPGVFLWDMCRHIFPDIPKESAFSKEMMTWKLMHLLPEQLEQPDFALLRHYLQDDDDQRKLHQLAGRIADLFDQYLIYRPQWIAQWQAGRQVDGLGGNQLWQAALWRALVDYTRELQQPEWHHAMLYQRFIQTLEKAKTCPPGLPPRIFICGISALPPVHLQALHGLARHIDVHLLFTNPCRHYWSDIQDYKFLSRLKNRHRRLHRWDSAQPESHRALFRDPQQADGLFNAEGEQRLNNPLLSSWGKLGRDHLYLLAELDALQEVDAFVDLDADSLLRTLQRDILELEDHAVVAVSKASLETSVKKRPLDRRDRSVDIHACHSPQREVEVLHDQILSMMADDPQLTPRDIIVMMADIDGYTPFIQAVFGNAPPERHLPYAISDQRARYAHPALQAVINLLDLPNSRFTAEQVLALLEVPALAARFGIQEEGLRRLRLWVVESGIRWGLDDDNVRELRLPATGQHTWRFGLTRMLLGYAMDSQAGEWQGVLPYDESSGLVAELAGQLAELLMQLHGWRQRLSQPRELTQWLPVCRQLLETFFEADSDTEAALALIEKQWQHVLGMGTASQYPQAVPISILRDELSRRLDQERLSQRFLAGAINFCTLMPMRSIPFKVVCLLGMNDGVYPRTLPPLGFDLMGKSIRQGDRSRRDDDRYLFLEAMLSAQNKLYISYIGRSIQDNTRRYPSVLVSELTEYIAQSHYLPDDAALDIDSSAERVIRHLCHEHSRMPFDAKNFLAEPVPQSFAGEWLAAANRQGRAAPDFDRELPQERYTDINLDDLKRFYRHPVRAFFQHRLGVRFMLQNDELLDEEPFTLDNLSRYQLNTELLNTLIAQEDPARLYRRVRAAGGLPFGAFGELYWQAQQEEMAELAARIREEMTPGAAESMEIDIRIDDVHLRGWLAQVQPDGLLRWRPVKLAMTDGMMLWLEHLVYCLSGGQGESRMYGREKTAWRFAPIPEKQALALLQQLLDGYQQGMNKPLLLLNKSGGAWLAQCYDRESDSIQWDDETQSKARAKLLSAWQGNKGAPGEGEDDYLHRIVREWDEKRMNEIIEAAQIWLLPPIRSNLA
ncbi:DNA helicase/exodeoxyribonuclease V gamma subunit|uniref:RecBCD enzyme subunit RecC n=1 Tax=Brenneria salicis ATCC 15712 = DSM 30166 TaxID=714314 RepID=A0A366I9E6_9GAMM|nr:exodeoxyribonuclease V subunit gamma [Brenneria salicis]NMN92557.1 DNA helicase/exodeoxyribonuclease V gamma subunit [Brenneria salicis ATCC 15712 = DSM 30166]RBP64575.1 DNA helicase/exodeoxyribonuclease V gamma subunit [Brenneria salicis ATCC 15712 = DSM 30166]RLM31351.1 exodeoxyribonuclease V subunit gamma [Brenneria salicis ATCC 15712 = DSM 30166]